MKMKIVIEYKFIDRTGKDVTGTEEVAGYHWADFFRGSDDWACSTATTLEEADRKMAAAYKGRDIDGIGVRWRLSYAPDA